MVPALKFFITFISPILLFLAWLPVVSFAQSSGKPRIVGVSDAADSSEPALDEEARELLTAGRPGFLIESVRSEVLSILSESSSCSAWYLSADPSAREKFRSLHFALDLAGDGEILKVEGTAAPSGYYHPYVASTLQDVGPGSTITVNANGAFFRTSAFVRDSSRPADRISAASYRLLSVGNYSGGSPEAQLLTILHEFGHIVDLLPVDAEVPSAPFVSIRNTEIVLHHCDSQIRAHAKHLRWSENSARTLPLSFVSTRNSSAPQLQAAVRTFHEIPYRKDGW